MASPLVHTGILLLCLSGMIWRQGPYIRGHGDMIVKEVIPVGYKLTCTILVLNLVIQWHVAVGFNPVQKLPVYEFLNKENK